MRDRVFDIEDFKKRGFQALEDTTSAPVSALREMKNAQVTDRGGIAPRPGTKLLGSNNSAGEPIRGFYNFRKSFSSDEILLKAYGTKLEAYSKVYSDQGWFLLEDGFTDGSEFGFVTSLVNEDNQDYVIFCNKDDKYRSWTGEIAQISTALSGGETSITVDSTLLDDIYESETATSSSTTTLDVSGTPWAASQWVNFYVRITSGSEEGQVRKITANTNSQITFDALGSDPGNCTFEVRKLRFAESGTMIYNGTTIAYTDIPADDTITVGSAHAAPINTLITVVPATYEAAPRGNRIANYLSRIIVGNVKSALSRDSGGNKQGFSSTGSYFVSKLNDPFDFDFSATRTAGEGDIVSTPYGGGNITDVATQEDSAYIFKKYYIEAVQYSQDSNDLAVREPLTAGIGSIGKTTRGKDDVYFFTGTNVLTSIGRVRAKDIRPQTEDISHNIRRYLDSVDLSSVGRGIEVGEKMYFSFKSESSKSENDTTLVYNRETQAFEGIWDIGAYAFEEFDGKYYYASSTTPNVYQLFVDHADVEGTTRFPISFNVDTHYLNLTSSKAHLQAMYGIVLEGYIRGGTSFDVRVNKDFSGEPFLSFTFAATEDGFLDGNQAQAFLGGKPLAINPLAAVFSDPDNDGRRHFFFKVFFPYQYGNFFSPGLSSSAKDEDYEVTRFGLIIKETPSHNANRVKVI